MSGAPARMRAGARRTGARAARLAAAVRDFARGESRWRRLLWALVALVLTLGPLALNLARAPQHEASVALFPQRVGPYPAVGDPAAYRALLDDPVLREQMRLNVGVGVARYGDVTLERGPRGEALVLTVAAETPADAQRFVNALAPQIAGATQRQLAGVVSRDAAALRARLRGELRRRDRATLRRRLRRLEALDALPPTRVLPGAAAPRPRLERWADRLVDDLPGEFPARPAPAWAALAGLLVALTLWGVALAVAPPRR
jgi:hypothetical protein